MDKNLTQALALIEHEPGAFSNKVFVSLSDLSRTEMALFQAAWGQWSLARRQQLMRALYDYAQEHVDIDYTAILLWALNDADPVVRRLAIEGLWEDNDHALIARLVQALRTDPDEDVRAVAAQALARFVLLGEYEEIPSAAAASAVETLFAALASAAETASVKQQALEAIGFASDERVRGLIEDAYDDEDELTQASALRAMGNSADSYWNPLVRRELQSHSTAKRLAAVYAAGELELTIAVPCLIPLLSDPDLAMRRAAAQALGKIGGRSARQALQLVIQGDDETLRPFAIEALEVLDFNHASFSAHDTDDPALNLDDEDDNDDLDQDFADDFDRDFDEDFDEDDFDDEDFDDDDDDDER